MSLKTGVWFMSSYCLAISDRKFFLPVEQSVWTVPGLLNCWLLAARAPFPRQSWGQHFLSLVIQELWPLCSGVAVRRYQASWHLNRCPSACICDLYSPYHAREARVTSYSIHHRRAWALHTSLCSLQREKQMWPGEGVTSSVWHGHSYTNIYLKCLNISSESSKFEE